MSGKLQVQIEPLDDGGISASVSQGGTQPIQIVAGTNGFVSIKQCDDTIVLPRETVVLIAKALINFSQI